MGDRDEIIKREIKIREARRSHELVKLTIHLNKDLTDTFAVYYEAKIKVHTKDSTINDSLFFIKMKGGAYLPFITSKE